MIRWLAGTGAALLVVGACAAPAPSATPAATAPTVPTAVPTAAPEEAGLTRILQGLGEVLDGLTSYRATIDHLGGSAVTYTIVNAPVRAYEMTPEVIAGSITPHTILIDDTTWVQAEGGSWLETPTPGDLPFCRRTMGSAFDCSFGAWIWLDEIASRSGTFVTVAGDEVVRGSPTLHLRSEHWGEEISGTLDIWIDPSTGMPLRTSYLSTEMESPIGRTVDIDRINDSANTVQPPPVD